MSSGLERNYRKQRVQALGVDKMRHFWCEDQWKFTAFLINFQISVLTVVYNIYVSYVTTDVALRKALWWTSKLCIKSSSEGRCEAHSGCEA